MKYAVIKKNDIANGPGVRVSLFVSGCNHHCKGCFNKIAWDFDYGTPFTEETIKEILDSMSPVHIKGLTLLGGEPLDPANQGALLLLVKKVKETYPDKTIWCFSGYDFEKEIMCDMIHKVPETKSLLDLIDVLVDGRFEIDKKDITLRFRGSSNQRIIDMNKTRAANSLVLWDEQETL